MQPISYPLTRPRRLRCSPFIRELTQEVRLHPSDFIWPIFIQEGENQQTPIASLPEVGRLSIDVAVAKAKALHAKGLQTVALFPVTDASLKNTEGSEALNPDNLICRAIRLFKKEIPTLGIIADVALDPYTSHGHDGVLGSNGDVVNDATIDILAQQAQILAKAGADIVAPSDMMDGRVGAIRMALEMEGFFNTVILAYSAKYASAFYGPFRDAVGSRPMTPPAKSTDFAMRQSSGLAQSPDRASSNTDSNEQGQQAERAVSPRSDAPSESQEAFTGAITKASYQMHPANISEALKEAALDVAEGADMLMVKPGLPYLDVIAALKKEFPLPILAYHVSGEYAGVMFAAEAGAIDAKAVLIEQMLCFKRAGANAIFTYAAPQLMDWI